MKRRNSKHRLAMLTDRKKILMIIYLVFTAYISRYSCIYRYASPERNKLLHLNNNHNYHDIEPVLLIVPMGVLNFTNWF